MAERRQLRPCRFCGFAYRGRGIYSDHGFAKYNLEKHEDACLAQQAAKVEHRKRRLDRKIRRAVKKGAPPGQLGFPFDGVPQEVEIKGDDDDDDDPAR